MRVYSAALVAVLATHLASSVALAIPPARQGGTKQKAAQFEPLPAAKADVILVGRALSTRELPKSVTAEDKKLLDAVVVEFRSDRFEAAVAVFRNWARTASPRLSHDEITISALWVFQEGVLSRNEELANAADRVRFFDERNAALDDSLALLRGAAIAKKPVLVARLVVLTPYAKNLRGDTKQERQVTRDELPTEIRTFESRSEATKVTRDEARAAFAAIEPTQARALQALAAIAKA